MRAIGKDRSKLPKLKSSESDCFHTMLEAFPCIALLVRYDTREVVAANRRAVQVGIIPGEKCYRTLGKRENPCSFCLAPSAWGTMEGQHRELELCGSFANVYWVPVSEKLYLHFALDNTQKKEIEESLKEKEQKYSYLFDNMLNGYAYCELITDEEGKPADFAYLEVNTAFEKLTGLKKSDVLGRRATEVFPGIGDSHPELIDTYGRVANTGIAEQFEIYFIPLEMWLSVTAYSHKKGFFDAVFENITEQKLARKKLEEYSQGLELTVDARNQELAETNERLLKAERFAAIGELAGMVGHDLRNPLTSIKNAAYYLNRKRGTVMDAKEKSMFEVIDKSVDHANKIIANLLDYSREISLEIEECTPKSLIDYVLLMTQIPGGIRVHDDTKDEPTMWVDSNKLERVFINLIKNAIDAMPNGGTLCIASEQIGENVEFTFTDTGTGMSEQTMSKIFMPLFTTKAQGMGFGLAICKRIVEAHCGKISVFSTVGQGTKFTVSLPIEQELKVQAEDPELTEKTLIRPDSLKDSAEK